MSFNYIKGWDSTLVHLTREVLPVSDLTCFFNISSFFLPTLLPVAYEGGVGPPFDVMVFSRLAYHDL